MIYRENRKTDQEYFFWIGRTKPLHLHSGNRVYVVAYGKLRGYSPFVRYQFDSGAQRWALVRKGRAVAVTVPWPIRGFQGWRYADWQRFQEEPFPEWRIP